MYCLEITLSPNSVNSGSRFCRSWPAEITEQPLLTWLFEFMWANWQPTKNCFYYSTNAKMKSFWEMFWSSVSHVFYQGYCDIICCFTKVALLISELWDWKLLNVGFTYFQLPSLSPAALCLLSRSVFFLVAFLCSPHSRVPWPWLPLSHFFMALFFSQAFCPLTKQS